MLLQNIWHMFKYLLKTQIRCFFTTYSHAGQKWNFSIFAPTQFLNYWILQRGVLGEEFFFGQKISYNIKVQHISFTSHFQPLINMKYSFEQIHPKMQENGQICKIHLYRLSSKFGAKKSKIWIFWNKYYNNLKNVQTYSSVSQINQQ